MEPELPCRNANGRLAAQGHRSAKPLATGEFILRTTDLTKSFHGFAAVNRVNLGVRRGDVHALIGPNGAGKTTCFNLITKFLTPTSGSISYDGADITRSRPAEVARDGMVRSFQISATFPHMTLLENMQVALQRPLNAAYKFWRSAASLRVVNERAMWLLGEVGLADYARLTAAELSYGRKRALEIATTIALEPQMLLLDEPTAGMSHEDVAPMTRLIRRVAAGRTVLMVEHNLAVVADLSDRITVLARGEIIAEGTYAEVSRDRGVMDAYMGTGDE